METLILFLAMVCNQGCEIDTNSQAEEMDITTPAVSETKRYIVQTKEKVVYINLYPREK